jgi:Tfp pilus assembly protein PilN
MVQVIPKEEIQERESLVVVVFLWISFLSLVVVSGLYFLINWQNQRVQDFLATIETQISQIGTQQQKDFKESIFNYKRKIDDAAALLKAHKEPTKIFDVLETTVHPEVILTDVNYQGGKTERLNLSGNAKDMISLAQQILLIERHPKIERVALTSVNIGGDNRLNFRLETVFKPEALLMQE